MKGKTKSKFAAAFIGSALLMVSGMMKLGDAVLIPIGTMFVAIVSGHAVEGVINKTKTPPATPDPNQTK